LDNLWKISFRHEKRWIHIVSRSLNFRDLLRLIIAASEIILIIDFKFSTILMILLNITYALKFFNWKNTALKISISKFLSSIILILLFRLNKMNIRLFFCFPYQSLSWFSRFKYFFLSRITLPIFFLMFSIYFVFIALKTSLLQSCLYSVLTSSKLPYIFWANILIFNITCFVSLNSINFKSAWIIHFWNIFLNINITWV
jgi:hypothetical protein